MSEKFSKKRSKDFKDGKGPHRQDSLRNVSHSRQHVLTVEEFVKHHDGKRPIRKILIANNGIAAVKFIRSIRSWTYETFKDNAAIRLVCMVTPEDRNANAEYIKMSDKIEIVPGGSNQYNYANVDLILDVAVRAEVDAVWAGWGHASENPKLPEILSKHNIIFIGPPHGAMWCLGDKVASTIFAQSAEVPTLPWSGQGLLLNTDEVKEDVPENSSVKFKLEESASSTSINSNANAFKIPQTQTINNNGQNYYGQSPRRNTWTAEIEEVQYNMDQHRNSIQMNNESYESTSNIHIQQQQNKGSLQNAYIPEQLYYQACITDANEGLERAANNIGFPVMIKASEGGGGKGIRKVTGPENFHNMFTQVQNEVPGSPIFLMKFADHARHLEVQILADQYGTAISLFGRDCSVQRRHQKILEEAPVIVAPEDVFERMEKAAIRLAQMVGYVSAGTVEYLYDINTQEFYFLELNPRLQVEHPCTEVVCDVNLPACQVQVAMGIPLHRIKDIRQFHKQDPMGSNLIDFTDPANKPHPNGHVIAVRITSENPEEGFKPSPGAVEELNFKSNRSVWSYFSVGSVGGIHEYSDSQFGHCFSFAENREKARENMVLTLKELNIRGDFHTTVEYLIRILESENYVMNDIDTGWLDYLIMQKVQVSEGVDPVLAAMCAAIHVADMKFVRIFNTYQILIERRQISKSQKLTNTLEVVLIHDNVKYCITVCKTGPVAYHLIMNDSIVEAEVHRLLDGCLLITYDNASYTTYCKEEIYGFRTLIDNHTITFEKESDPSVLVAPSAGRLVQYVVDDGGHVPAASVYAYMEVMKLTMELRTTASGFIHFVKRCGAILDAGCHVATLTLDDPGQVIQAENYSGPFYVSNQQSNCVVKLNQVFEKSLRELEQILEGYCLPQPFFKPRLEKTVNQLMTCLRDPRLPLVELQELISQISGRIPQTVERHIKHQMSRYASNVTSVLCQFPASQILHFLEQGAQCLFNKEADRDNYRMITQPIMSLVKKYTHGVRGYMKTVIETLFDRYYNVEKEFQEGHYDKCVSHLIGNFSKDKNSQVMMYVFSHQNVDSKNQLILLLIDHLVQNESGLIKDLHDSFVNFTNLNKAKNSKVSLKARQVLISSQNPAYEVRHNQVESIFLSAIDRYGHHFRPENLEKLILSETVVFDIIFDFFYHSNPKIISAALEVYVRRAYIAYELTCVHQCQLSNKGLVVEFRFLLPSSHPDRNVQTIYRPMNDLKNPMTNYYSMKNETLGGSNRKQMSFPAFALRPLFSTPSNESMESSANLESPTMNPQQFKKTNTLPNPDGSNSSLSDYLHGSGYLIDQQSNHTGLPGQTNTTSLDSLIQQPDRFDESNNLPLGGFSNSGVRDNNQNMTGSNSGGGNSSNKLEFHSPPCQRMGLMGAFISLKLFEEIFDEVMSHFSLIEDRESPSLVNFQDPPYTSTNPLEEPIHIINIALREESKNDDQTNERILEDFCQRKQSKLIERGIRRITFIISDAGLFPRYFTFRARMGFREDCIYRHLEPALAFQLEINRMRNYNLELIPVVNRRMHMYLGKAKVSEGQEVTDFRLFVRTIIRHADLVTKEASFEYLANEAERTLLESLDALELAMSHPDSSRTNCNHIFLNFAPTLTLPDMARLEETIRGMVMRYGSRIWKLRVAQAELKMIIRFTDQGQRIPIRLWLANEGGYELEISIYKEVMNPDTGQIQFKSFCSNSSTSSGSNTMANPGSANSASSANNSGGNIGVAAGVKKGKWHGMALDTPYQTKDHLQIKRFQAIKYNTTYVYDYPKLINQALETIWNEYDPNFLSNNPDIELVSYVELVLTDTDSKNPKLKEVKQMPATNTIGMVAWRMRLLTPETINSGGREIILISNDVTYKNGSFSILEDALFQRASEYSRKLGLPRLYFASNAGARIGIAEEIKNVFKVAWYDPMNVEKGYKYLYLSPTDYKQMTSLNNVTCEKIEDEDEVRYKIIDIIGKEDGIGVENLRASGMIAGETSLAYDEVVTISLVSNRSVGIGAYLMRLGSRIVQVENSHIILTGYAALNKVLGRDVYTSNNQLGGVQIMAHNGVSHAVVEDDLKGCECMLKWLSYIPAKRGDPLPILMPKSNMDPVNRDVSDSVAPNPITVIDPRLMITGQLSDTGDWEGGLFDKDSWSEIMHDWASNVIVGRARLGGIPVAIITPETRTVTMDIPADPANPSSEFQQVTHAGQVWFPSSAYKTAQAIRDFGREELPLFILANWRGFSGGMMDMYDEVLKFGSYIVDELKRYTRPVFVYIPPHCELRGGAWVVLDETINKDFIEMYADSKSAKGGVLEPQGTVEIKYKERDIEKTIQRLDPECLALRKEIVSLEKKDLDLRESIQRKIKARIKSVLPAYLQVAISFASLHDTPGRMLTKGVLQGVVDWKDSRRVFYRKLSRRLLEWEVIEDIEKAQNIGGKESSKIIDSSSSHIFGSTNTASEISESCPKTSSRPNDCSDVIDSSRLSESRSINEDGRTSPITMRAHLPLLNGPGRRQNGIILLQKWFLEHRKPRMTSGTATAASDTIMKDQESAPNQLSSSAPSITAPVSSIPTKTNEALYLWDDDELMIKWLTEQIRLVKQEHRGVLWDQLAVLKREKAHNAVKKIIQSTPEVTMHCLVSMVQELSATQLQSLSKLINNTITSTTNVNPIPTTNDNATVATTTTNIPVDSNTK